MAKRTALYDWHLAHGGRMVDFAGWDMPVQYSSITDEHQVVRTSLGVFDISHMGRLVFEGPDALDLIQRLYTNDAASMKPGQVRYGLVCNAEGGIRDDVLVYRLAPFWLMVVNASNRDKILGWIEANRAGSRVQVADRTSEWAMVAVQGPRAPEVIRAAVPSAAYLVEGLRYYFAAAVAPETGDPARQWILSRTGYTCEDGFEVILPGPEAPAFADRVLSVAKGQQADAKPCGLGARDTLRLEAAMPLYGHELSEEIDPYQADLAWAVKMEKGEFIGRAALDRRRQDPALRRRIGLEVDGKRLAREGAAVLAGGREVGRVTSGTFAPTLARAIAMAYVEPAHAGVGSAVEVDVRGRPASARVVALPFYRRPRK